VESINPVKKIQSPSFPYHGEAYNLPLCAFMHRLKGIMNTPFLLVLSTTILKILGSVSDLLTNIEIIVFILGVVL